MKNQESIPNKSPSPEKEIPEWARNIQIGHYFWMLTYLEMKKELGEYMEGDGDIGMKRLYEIRKDFYDFIQHVEDAGEVLPEFIPLGEIYRQTGIELEEDSLAIYPQGSDTRYFLPQTYELYEAPWFFSREIHPELYPDCKEFEGFDKIREEVNKGKGMVCLFSVKPLPIEEALKDEKSRAPNLEEEDIDNIFVYFESCFLTDESKKLIQKYRSEIAAINITSEETEIQARKKYIARIKQRIVNLSNAVNEAIGGKLPEAMLISGFASGESGKKIDVELYFLPKEGKLIMIPKERKKGLKERLIKVPDFHNANDAPEEAWLDIGLFGNYFLDFLPADTREKIKSSRPRKL